MLTASLQNIIITNISSKDEFSSLRVKNLIIICNLLSQGGPSSSVGIATGYGQDGPGIDVFPKHISKEWTLRPIFHYWTPQKQAAIVWIVAHLVAYRLQAQRSLSLTDYMDFLKRARWKEYQRATKKPTVRRYLDVFSPPPPQLHRIHYTQIQWWIGRPPHILGRQTTPFKDSLGLAVTT